MRNFLLFGMILSITITSLVVGSRRFSAMTAEAAELASVSTEPAQSGDAEAPAQPTPVLPVEQYNIPHIGSIQVLNGCGVTGAADKMSDFLQSKKFDVKDKGNAQTFNYPATMVVSRTADMGLASEIEKILKTGHVVPIRNNDQLYDVTVIVGPDFEKLISGK